MKKLLAFLLALTMIVGAMFTMVSCGKDDDKNADNKCKDGHTYDDAGTCTVCGAKESDIPSPKKTLKVATSPDFPPFEELVNGEIVGIEVEIIELICEELGFVGGVFALLLFGILIFSGYKIALRAEDVFSRLTAFGISTKMAIQVLLNVSVVTNTIPNTGISLPFFSYGGSSLIMIFFEMGILLSISRYAKITK